MSFSSRNPSSTLALLKVQRGAPIFLWAILTLSAILRVVMVVRGGQYFNPDEDRYLTSKESAKLLAGGFWNKGISHPFEAGDHVGFKFIGIIPALIEEKMGDDPRIPALYFGSFSLLSVFLLGKIVRRMGGSEWAEVWACFLGATSSTLFYNARHILPYDASLALALWHGGLASTAPLHS